MMSKDVRFNAGAMQDSMCSSLLPEPQTAFIAQIQLLYSIESDVFMHESALTPSQMSEWPIVQIAKASTRIGFRLGFRLRLCNCCRAHNGRDSTAALAGDCTIWRLLCAAGSVWQRGRTSSETYKATICSIHMQIMKVNIAHPNQPEQTDSGAECLPGVRKQMYVVFLQVWTLSRHGTLTASAPESLHINELAGIALGQSSAHFHGDARQFNWRPMRLRSSTNTSLGHDHAKIGDTRFATE